MSMPHYIGCGVANGTGQLIYMDGWTLNWYHLIYLVIPYINILRKVTINTKMRILSNQMMVTVLKNVLKLCQIIRNMKRNGDVSFCKTKVIIAP